MLCGAPMRLRFLALCALASLAGCESGSSPSDSGTATPRDAATDAADATPSDAAPLDAHVEPTDAALPVDGGPEPRCPAGSSSLVLSLAGVSLARVAGVPIDDGFASGFSIVEGPVWARGALWVSHFAGGATPASRVYRITPDGSVSIGIASAGTNGLALGADGALFGARHADGSISRFDWDALGAAPEVVIGSYMGARFNTPNDLVVRSDGQIYFSDPDWQAPAMRPQSAERAYHLDLDGVVHEIDGAPSKPNGVALSLDERTLFVTGTDGMRRYSLGEDGAIVEGPFAVGSVSGGLDGLGRDCAGNLYVTGGDRVVVLDRALARIGELSAPGATNVAFGGDDMRTIYVTALGGSVGVYSARLNVPGLPD